MNISIFGLGYVGTVCLGCFADEGHNMIGIDIIQSKLDIINSGKSAIVENEVDKLIRKGVMNNNISATNDYLKAVENSEIAFICVGTPVSIEGNLNLENIYEVSRQIGEGLRNKSDFFTVVIRSTVLPGTNEKAGKIIEEISKKKLNADFCIVNNPEFLREGSAVYDFFNPPMTVLASDCEKGLKIVTELYKKLKAPIDLVSIRSSESIKLINNSYHALKICFANEVGNICKKLKIDSEELMGLFSRDNKLNISPVYFKPGFAYGGSCLTKDLKALNMLAKENNLNVPVLKNIEHSNNIQKENAFDLISSKNVKKVGIYGLSFKTGTDDIRESPIIDILEMLLERNYEIKIFDEFVNLSNLIGSNKDYLYKKIPHIAKLLVPDFKEILNFSELLVINNSSKKFIEEIKSKPGLQIIDLVYIPELKNFPDYQGISW
jgi:GDP-mannose 6-dehydrogenase